MPAKYKIREICTLRQECGLSCHNCCFVKRCKKDNFKIKENINNRRKGDKNENN